MRFFTYVTQAGLTQVRRKRLAEDLKINPAAGAVAFGAAGHAAMKAARLAPVCGVDGAVTKGVHHASRTVRPMEAVFSPAGCLFAAALSKNLVLLNKELSMQIGHALKLFFP